MAPTREQFTNQEMENLESLVFSILQIGEINWIQDGVPVDLIADLADLASPATNDLCMVNEDGFVYIYNGSAWVLVQDYLVTAGTSAPTPQVGVISPEGVLTSRYVGDIAIDTAADKMYFNNVAGVDTGWKILTSA